MKGRLLDFGCGSKPYRSLFAVDEYIGLDFEKTGHDHTGEQIDVFYDGKTIPFPDRHFDCILCSEVFEHLFNLPEVLLEMKRVLKSGGVLLVTCPFVWSEHEIPFDYARYTQFALMDLVTKQGMEVMTFEKEGNFIEAIAQMKVLGFSQWAAPLFKLSYPGRVIHSVGIYLKNCWGSLKSFVFPKKYDLYLTNILFIKKH